MEERCFHRQSPPVIDVWCVHSKVCSEKCYFDSASADYLSCHFVLPGLKASVDRLNVFICVNTFFLLMNPLSIEEGGVFDMWHPSGEKVGRDKLWSPAMEACMVFIYAFSNESVTQRTNCFPPLFPLLCLPQQFRRFLCDSPLEVCISFAPPTVYSNPFIHPYVCWL